MPPVKDAAPAGDPAARETRSGDSPAGDSPAGDSPAVWLIALAQTLGYACLFYSFAALILTIEADLGWSRSQLALGPTLSLAVAAVTAPAMGRLVDRGWGGEMIWAAPILGAVSLLGLSQVTGMSGWLLFWALGGLSQAFGLYETCFSFLTRRLGSGARAAIIRVTLVAGFASTLAFPAGAALASAFGWRGALLVCAGVELLVTAPLAWWGVSRLRARARAEGAGKPLPDPPGALGRALARPEFWLLAAVFGLLWMNHALLMTYALPVFADRGATAGFAVFAAACIGPAQVAGRVVFMLNEARLGTWGATKIGIGSFVLAGLLLFAAGSAPMLILGFALAQGAAAGLFSILRPVLTAEVLGRSGFGAISGALAVAPLSAMAAGPYLGALLQDAAGVHALISAGFALALISAMAAAVVITRHRRAAAG